MPSKRFSADYHSSLETDLFFKGENKFPLILNANPIPSNLASYIPVDYHGSILLKCEAEVLQEFEQLLNKPIVQIDNVECNSFGFVTMDHRVIQLNLYGQNLRSIPKNIGNLSTLTYLNLTNNSISSIPKSLGELKFLKELYLGHNRLRIIPSRIWNLTNLEILNISWNKLSIIPDGLRQLKELKEIGFHNNKINILPESIGNLVKLKIISLWGNNIRSLPASIGNLISLEYLCTNYSPSYCIPESIENMKSIEIIDLYQNELTLLPSQPHFDEDPIIQIKGRITNHLMQVGLDLATLVHRLGINATILHPILQEMIEYGLVQFDHRTQLYSLM